jgi:Spx/MgsR family transcriptional regulator
MSDTPLMYGIPNCNTIKKARAWLEERGIDYQFHDYRKAGTDPAQLQAWIDEFGWDRIVNTRGMTWRKLDEDTRASMNPEAALQLMLDKPSIIKRPLLVVGDQQILGFDEAAYAAAFDAA